MQLVATNEQLEKNVELLRLERESGVSEPREENIKLEDEIRRLQALNSALQKNLSGIGDIHLDRCFYYRCFYYIHSNEIYLSVYIIKVIFH